MEVNFPRMRIPWVFGAFAIYARSIHSARQVYDQIKDHEGLVEPFGTLSMASGEKVIWINIRYIPSEDSRKPT